MVVRIKSSQKVDSLIGLLLASATVGDRGQVAGGSRLIVWSFVLGLKRGGVEPAPPRLNPTLQGIITDRAFPVAAACAWNLCYRVSGLSGHWMCSRTTSKQRCSRHQLNGRTRLLPLTLI